jgi:cyclin-dependent kinase-like
MAFIHSHNIMHRDIKPENMLLSKNGVLKICDFGFARTLVKSENARFTDYVSTRWYRAPELLVGYTQYTNSVDIWAIGCIFVELVTGRPLFTGDSDYETLKMILEMFNESEELPDKLKLAFYNN